MKLFMKNIKYLFLTFILVLFIFNIKIVILSSKEASLLFFNKIFITIFPFIILSDILIYYDYHIFLKNTIGKFISKLFNIDPNVSIIFILSILTSTPNNAVFIKDMLDNNEIDNDTANKILTFTYFPSISFIIGSIGISIYKSFKIGFILWILCLFYNILIGIFTRSKIKFNRSNIKRSLKEKDDFFNILKKSIIKGINTSIIILGNLIIFTIIINLLNKYLNINNVLYAIISGFLEMTSGIVSINSLNINLNYKFILTFLILSFSGLSILFQSRSILSDYKINIKRTLIIKLVFSIIISLVLWCVTTCCST